MKHASLMLRGAALAAALCAASVPALAQQSQWNKPAKTNAQRTAILKKEINAAYAEQQATCRKQSSGQRASCLQAARQTYRQDMSNVPRLVANAPQSSVTERIVSVTPATPASSTASSTAPAAGAPGTLGNPAYPSTAYGSSSAGSTSSGSANASADAASGSAPASMGAAPGTPSSSVTGEGGQSGAMMPEPTKPLQPQNQSQQPDTTSARQQ